MTANAPDLYCSATIKISVSDDGTQVGCSAVFLSFKDNLGPAILLSSSPAFCDLPKGYEIHVTVADLIDQDNVPWYPAEIQSRTPLSSTNSFLAPFGQYSLEPTGQSTKNACSLTVLKSKLSFNLPRKVWKDLTMVGVDGSAAPAVKPGAPLTVHSNPYALVNPALFSDYVSTGALGHVSGGVYLADIRYLDGMDGGIVFLGSSFLSLGLVCGGLTKLSVNGKGNDGGASGVLVISPWTDIAKTITEVVRGSRKGGFLTNKKILTRLLPMSTNNLKSTAVPAKSQYSLPIVYLVVSTTGRGLTSWGSGIVVAPGIIATNAHVIANYRTITAYSGTQNTQVELFSEPINGLDMVFLSYRTSMLDVPVIEFRKDPVTRGTAVQSLGYGLFYPGTSGTSSASPLFSSGVVNSVLDLQVTVEAKEVVPAFLICSSKCWNGSSGGAVIDASTKELVGMMSSNGRNMASGKQIPEMTFVIPSQVISYGLSLALAGKQETLTSRSEDLWLLRNTHEQREIKL